MSVQTLYTAATGMESMRKRATSSPIIWPIATRLHSNATASISKISSTAIKSIPGSKTRHRSPLRPASKSGWSCASKARKRTTSKVRSNKQDAISTLRSKAKVSSKSLTTKRKARCTHAAEISISTPTDNWSSVQPRQVDFSIHRSPSLKVRPPSSSTPTGP